MSERRGSSAPAVRTSDGDWGRRKDDALMECETCGDLRRTQSGMDAHKFHAHGIDRRQTAEQKTPPPPEKRQKTAPKATPKEGEEEAKPKRSGSRWFNRPE